MSKSITIQEGGIARTLSGVEKIVTNVAGESGTQNWVPEDEAANYVTTGQLSISENGTYNSSDNGYIGYSKVEVSVNPDVGELEVTRNGTYYARDEGYDGFSKVEVDVESGGGELITKEITENGTYDAEDDDANGYSSVTVNVPSAGILITKEITANGTYKAIDDNANGFSTVTVNVAFPHGRVIVDGINHAPVTQKMNTRYFLEDLSEKVFLAAEPYLTNLEFKLQIEQKLRTLAWVEEDELTRLLTDDLVLLGWGGAQTENQVRLTLWGTGIMDNKGEVTLTRMQQDTGLGALYNYNDFTANDGKGTRIWGAIGKGSSCNFSDFTIGIFPDIDNNNRGNTQTVKTTNISMERSLFVARTDTLTNLTGGTVSP